MVMQISELIHKYTGILSITFFTSVTALFMAVYYLVTALFARPSKCNAAPMKPPFCSKYYAPINSAQPSERGPDEERLLRPFLQLGTISKEELSMYDGSDPTKPVLMAINGNVYDVSKSRTSYSPGGGYALLAGKDASRALAKMSFEEEDISGDISDLDAAELDTLADWESKFHQSYTKVGELVNREDSPVKECTTVVSRRLNGGNK